MTGYPDNASGAPTGSTTGYGSTPHATTASGTAATQGGYLGKAQAWTGRVTNNLTGQAEHIKGKLAGSNNAAAPSTAGAANTGYTAGTDPGMGSTTNTNYASHTGSIPAAGSGYNAQTGSGYAPADASGTHGHATKGASYTDQAKHWTGRIANNLSGQAEYLKTKVAGPSTTTGATGAPQDTARHTATTNPQSNYGASQAGYATSQATQGVSQGTHATPQGTQPAGQSWTDKAKQGLVAGLDYTQQGLEWTKNKVAGPTGTGTAGTTGTAVGHNTTGTHHQAGNTTFPSAPGGNTGFTGGNTGYTNAPGGGNPGYTGAPGGGNTGYSGGQTASGFTSAPGSGNTGLGSNTGGSGTGSQYPDVKY